MMKIILVAAMSENRAIGLNGRLPWGHLPDDYAHVLAMIKNKKTVMGMKSYDTPDRIASEAGNIVISRKQNLVLDAHFEYANSIADAFEKLKSENDIVILGGAQVFEQVIEQSDEIFLTLVHGIFEGDALFPNIDEKKFKLTETVFHPIDEKHARCFSFLKYVRFSD